MRRRYVTPQRQSHAHRQPLLVLLAPDGVQFGSTPLIDHAIISTSSIGHFLSIVSSKFHVSPLLLLTAALFFFLPLQHNQSFTLLSFESILFFLDPLEFLFGLTRFFLQACASRGRLSDA